MSQQAGSYAATSHNLPPRLPAYPTQKRSIISEDLAKTPRETTEKKKPVALVGLIASNTTTTSLTENSNHDLARNTLFFLATPHPPLAIAARQTHQAVSNDPPHPPPSSTSQTRTTDAALNASTTAPCPASAVPPSDAAPPVLSPEAAEPDDAQAVRGATDGAEACVVMVRFQRAYEGNSGKVKKGFGCAVQFRKRKPNEMVWLG